MKIVKFKNVDEIDISVDKYHIIGYYISMKGITLWLDKSNSDISLEDVKLLHEKCINDNIICYKNPPLDLWLNDHNDFIKALCSNLSNKYSLNKDNILSDIYYVICLLYKKNKYLGSLNYIRKSCDNFIKMSYRQDRFNKLISSGVIISLDTPLSVDDDIILSDIIEDTSSNDSKFDEIYKLLRISLLSVGMSSNEIRLILDDKFTNLSSAGYRRFLKWRKSHNIYEFLSDKE